jgi:hypothetical protein
MVKLMNIWQEKLQALKRHSLFPFSGFLHDASQYALVELYWSYLFRSLVKDSEWRPWHEPDRTGEGNPILSALNLGRERGVRVIQHPGQTSPTGQYFGFQPFLAVTPAEPFDPASRILELCFVSDISEESEALCLSFWKRFCLEFAAEEQMEHEIRSYELQVGMPDA